MTDTAVINSRVALFGPVQHQRPVSGGGYFLRADAVAVPDDGAVSGAEAQQQRRPAARRLPVPAEGGRVRRVAGTVGSVQQGAVQRGVLPDSHQDGRQTGGPET